MQFAENKTVLVLVHVLMNILEILTKDVDLNVFSILIVHQILLVFPINVKILALVLVVKMLFAKLLIICHPVLVSLDTLVIHLDTAMSFRMNVRILSNYHYHIPVFVIWKKNNEFIILKKIWLISSSIWKKIQTKWSQNFCLFAFQFFFFQRRSRKNFFFEQKQKNKFLLTNFFFKYFKFQSLLYIIIIILTLIQISFTLNIIIISNSYIMSHNLFPFILYSGCYSICQSLPTISMRSKFTVSWNQ